MYTAIRAKGTEDVRQQQQQQQPKTPKVLTLPAKLVQQKLIPHEEM